MADGLKVATAYVDVVAKDDASKGINQITGNAKKQVESVGASAKASLSTAFGAVKGLAGDALAPVLDLTEGMAKFGETVEEHGHTASAYLMGIGAAATAVGSVLMTLGSQETAASNQLQNAVENTGASWEAYEGKIEAVDARMAHYGYTAATTDNALQTLTIATGNTNKALRDSQIAADMAATSHTSLTSAATALARVEGGSGARVLRQYGVQVAYNADGTANWNKTVEALGNRLSGQADAASNTFLGRLKAIGAETENVVAVFGQKWGPTITTAGMLMLASGVSISSVGAKLVSGTKSFFGFGAAAGTTATEVTAATDEMAAGTTAATETIDADLASMQASLGRLMGIDEATTAEWEANAAARAAATAGEAAEVTAANEEMAASSEAGSGALAKLGGSAAAGTASLAAIAIGGYALGKSISSWIERGNAGISVMNNLGKSGDSLTEALVNSGGQIEQAGTQWAQAQVQSSGLADKAAVAGINIEQLTKGITGNNKQTQSLISTWKAQGAPADSTIFALLALHAQYAKLTEEQEKNEKAQRQQQATLTGLSSKFHELSSDTITSYLKMIGDTVDASGNVQGSMSAVARDVDLVRTAYDSATETGATFLDQLQKFATSSGTAADRAALIAATLQAANGDALNYANTMVSAADANQKLVDAMGATNKAGKPAIKQFIDLKTGALDYKNAGAQPLIGALDSLQSAALSAAQAQYQHKKATESGQAAAKSAYNTYVSQTKGALIDEAQHFGLTQKQAQRFADTYFGIADAKDIKKKIEQEGGAHVITVLRSIKSDLDILAGLKPKPKVEVDTTEARSQAKDFGNWIQSYINNISVSPKVSTGSNFGPGKSLIPQHHATGGYISGGGSATSDSILSWLSNGEEVETAASVRRNRAALDAANHGATLVPMSGGPYHGVHYPKSGGTKASGSSGGSSGSDSTKTDSTTSKQKWYSYHGLWYQGVQELNEAKAEFKSKHQHGIIEVGKGKNREYGYAGGGYDSLRDAENARTQARRDKAAQQRKNERQAGHLAIDVTGKDSLKVLHSLFGSVSDLASATRQVFKDAKQAVKLGDGSKSFLNELQADNTKLVGLARDRAAAVKQLNAAKTQLATYKKDYADEFSAVKDSFTGSFDITSAGSDGDAASSDRMIAMLKSQVHDAKSFSAELRNLKREGLSGTLLRQLAAGGPESANALALQGASKAEIAEINRLYGQLGKYGKQAGTTAANSLHNGTINDQIKETEKSIKADQHNVDKLSTHMINLEKAITKLTKSNLNVGKDAVSIGDVHVSINPGQMKEFKEVTDLINKLKQAARSGKSN